MPVLSPLFASVTDATTRSDTFVEAAATAALANGETYLVLVTANAGCDQTGSTTELEATFGGTRFAFTRYRAGASGSPGPATSGPLQSAFVVTGDGIDTVAVNFRRLDGDVTRDHFAIAHIACVPLGSLTLNTHYWLAEATNSDTLTNPAAGAGWEGSGEQVDVTPGATGNFLVIATGESEFTAGHSAADLSRFRCRVTEDPAGTPASYNLQRNTVADPDVDGPQTRIEGGHPWGNYSLSQRFVDVLSLTSGTTYRFELEREGVAGTANTGYRRERVYVFDLSAWPEFAFSRDVDGQSTADATFATASASAPSAALDYVLLGATTYSNNNTWIRCSFTLDPSGTPSQLPSSEGFGTALTDNGNTLTDDYALIGIQWDQQGVTTAQDYAVNCVGTLQVCRWGHEHGDFPGGVDDGIATLAIAWGMETSVASGTDPLVGTSAGSGTLAGTLTGVAALAGTSTGTATASGTLSSGSALAGTTASSSTATGTLSGAGAISGTSAGVSSASLNSSTGILGTDAVVGFIGNSYTQNYGSMPTLLAYYIGQRIGGATVDLDATPHLATTIANSGTDGYFPGMSLAGMCLYPTVDQSSGGSTDAIDALDSVAIDTYDSVVFTSGFRRDDGAAPGLDYELPNGIDPGANVNTYGVNLEVARQVATLIRAETSGSVILRMTQEGFNANTDTSLSDMERITQIQVLGARQLEAEGVVDYVVPDHYVWARLQWGSFGSVGSGVTTAVPAYASLTHTNSSQPGGANLAWMNRSQGDTAPFSTNGHQNAIATIIHAWIWGYAMWGIDPRGDTTFQGPPTGLPSPFDNMLNSAGDRIYGGHNTGLGNLPYDIGTNPSGPPDSELDLDWSAATQLEIQDRIVAAIDDYNAGLTEWDAVQLAGTSTGSSTAAGTLSGAGAIAGTSPGTSTASGGLTGTGAIAAQAAGVGTATGTMVVPGVIGGTSVGVSSATGTLSGVAALAASEASTSTATGAMRLPMAALAAASSSATAALSGTGAISGTSAGVSTATLVTGGYSGTAWTQYVTVTLSNPVIPLVLS